jgi:hypothetical protein
MTTLRHPDRTAPARGAADLLRALTLVSAIAAALWFGAEGAVRLVLLFLFLLALRFTGLPRLFDVALCFTLLLATWAGVAHWYAAMPWLDLVVHCITTGATAAALYLVLALERTLGAEHVAVALEGLGLIAANLNPAGLEQLQPGARRAPPDQDPDREGEPVHDRLRLQDAHVEQTVGGAGLWQYGKATLKPTKVADQHALRHAYGGSPIIQTHMELGPRSPQVSQAAHQVGHGADALLQVGIGVREHGGIEANAAHDHEPALSGALSAPTSIWMRSPCSATSIAPSRSLGIRKLLASKLPVPASTVA